MFRLEINHGENYDETNNRFIAVRTTLLEFEHSLKSVSEWESKWKKPFLTKKGMTQEESISYIICMSLHPITEEDIAKISPEQMKQLGDYINDSQTATWINETEKSNSREIITSEIIYYWMSSLNIPLECENWHLSRLLTLIRVINEKNKPKKKMSKKELALRNSKLNAERCKKLNSKG